MTTTLPDEVKQFLAETRKRADALRWEWHRIEMFSGWRGGLDKEEKAQVEVLARIVAVCDGR